MKRLRVGVIGLGMGEHHVAMFKTCAEATVAAVADSDPNRLKMVAQKYDISAAYTDGFRMVQKENLDVVSIATPNKFHKPLTLAALKAGAHVLCEKPMALNAAEARQMLETANQLNRRLMINFSYRFTPQSQALKQAVDSGLLGEVYFARTVWHRRRGMPRFGGWFGQKALSGGGPLIDLGVHRLDLALWLMGYPKPVWVLASTYNPIASALARRERKAFDVEDLAVGLIRFANGATVEVEASWAANIRENELMETRLLGTKAGLVQRNCDEAYQFEAEIFLERDGAQWDMKLHAPPNYSGSAMAHFVDCIVHDKPHIATGEEGLIVMELLDAIYASAAKGRPVQIR